MERSSVRHTLQGHVDTDLVRRTSLSGFAYLSALLLVTYSSDVWESWRTPMIAVLAFTTVSATIRVGLGWKFAEFYTENAYLFRIVHRATLLLDAAVWGAFFAATLLEYGHSSWTSQLLTILNAGSAAVTLAVLIPALRLTWLFLALFVTPAMAANFYLGGERGITLGAIFAVYLAYTMTYSRRLHRTYIDSLRRNFALDEARRAAEDASRAKSEFLANISHELRTPMNGIMGMTHLARNTPAGLEQQEYLAAVESSSQHLLRLLNDLLDFAKIEAGKVNIERYPFSPAAVLEETMRAFRELALQKMLRLSGEIDCSVPAMVYGDGGRVRQILNNLTGNAVKFTGSGFVRVRLAVESRKESEVRLLFEVSDSGPGIAEDKQKLVFAPFEQSDRSMTRKFGGTGLGLSISENLARLMDGHITLESRLGEGSIFRCVLSFSVAEQDRPEQPAAEAAPLETPRRVLLAEDNLINQRLVTRLLEKRGHQVEIAANGREALHAVEKRGFDVVLMDVQMPEMDGLEVTTRIRRSPDEEVRGIRIVALTAHASAESRQEFLEAGMDDFLPKPIDPLRLYQAVEH